METHAPKLRNRSTRHIGRRDDIRKAVETGVPYRALCGVNSRASREDIPAIGGRICTACVDVYRNLLPGEDLPEAATWEALKRARSYPTFTYNFKFEREWK